MLPSANLGRCTLKVVSKWHHRCLGDSRPNVLALAHEFGAQDKTFDPVMAAVDLLGIICKPNRPDDRTLL
jgi:hypothetical protein